MCQEIRDQRRIRQESAECRVHMLQCPIGIQYTFTFININTVRVDFKTKIYFCLLLVYTLYKILKTVNLMVCIEFSSPCYP